MSDIIPEPQETGGSGTQQESSPQDLQLVNPEIPVQGLPLAATVQGLAATRARSLGGEVAASLIAGSFNHLSQELATTKRELQETQRKLENSRNELSEANAKKSVLEERLSTLGRIKYFSNLGIAVGTALVGFGVDFVKGKTAENTGYILLALGSLLILLAWFSNPAKSKA